MEELGERPIWSMSGGEMLAALDQVEADLARRQTYRLQLIAGLDGIGHAQEIGAHDTAQLLAFRYRLDPPQARRDLRLAVALPKYADVSAALPATGEPTGPRPADDPAHDPADDSAQPDDPASDQAEAEAEGDGAAAEGFLRPAQAEAIVSALERVPSTVPVEDIVVAEQQLVNLARHLSPGELRRAGQRIRDILDTDGPEPDERKAYDRETLTLSTADRGVKFRGYLANENAELLRSLIHAGARPHKTIDGELDPRPREKRQADALTTALALAAKATDITAPIAKPTRASAGDNGTADPATSDAVSTSSGADTGTTATAGAASAIPGAGSAIPGAGSASSGATTTGTPAGAVPGAATAPGGAVPQADGASVAATAPPATGRRPRVSEQVPGHGAKATITVTIDLQDLKTAAADATGNLVYGDGLSAAAIRRLACDAKIIPLVLGSNSEPLDVGRSERLVTRAMRRALNTRDKGCVVCGAPPIQCDAHHLRSWLDGGDTAISNLVLLCRRHHIDLHAGDWTITITNGVVHVARPTWADPPRRRSPRPSPSHPPPTAHRNSHANPRVDGPLRDEPLRDDPLPRERPRVDPLRDGPLSSERPRAERLRDDTVPSERPRVDSLRGDPMPRERPCVEPLRDEPLSSEGPLVEPVCDAAPSNGGRRVEPQPDALWSDDAADTIGRQSRDGSVAEGGASEMPARSGKHQADDATLQEAARFAVWGESSTKHPSVRNASDSAPPTTAATSAATTDRGPWTDTATPTAARPCGK